MHWRVNEAQTHREAGGSRARNMRCGPWDRIERFCRELDRSLIMSEHFVEILGQPMWELGHFELRGFSKLQRLFELPEEGYSFS